MEEDIPKRKKRKTSSPSKKEEMKDIDNSEDFEVDNDTEEFINKLMKSAVERYKDHINDQIEEYKIDTDVIQNFLTEYLDDFILLGFSPDKRRIMIRHCETPQGEDSICRLASVFIQKIIYNGRVPRNIDIEEDEEF